MQYQTGQAVIILETGKLDYVREVIDIAVYTVGCPMPYLNKLIRPATESEILAEAEKNGWDTGNTSLVSPKKHMFVKKLDNWELAAAINKPISKNLKEYCEEGLKAHTLITALNLVK